jgi:hypothetical protein
MIQEVEQNQPQSRDPQRWNSQTAAQLRKTLRALKHAAAQYWRLTGRPLGVADDVGRLVAAEILGLTLAPDPYAVYDAVRGNERILIAARAYPNGTRVNCPRPDSPIDSVMLVTLDSKSMNARGIWEVKCADLYQIHPRIRIQGLPIEHFKKIATQLWSDA